MKKTLTKLVAAAIGPREVGGRYHDYYFKTDYEVLKIDTAPADWSTWSITARYADGSITTHCTAWDPRDRVIS